MEESNFKKLIVWQKAMDLVDEVYALQRGFPKSEIFGLGDQLRRAVVSIPSNIAEGNGRTSPKELVHFLSIARGSVYEVVTQAHCGQAARPYPRYYHRRVSCERNLPHLIRNDLPLL